MWVGLAVHLALAQADAPEPILESAAADVAAMRAARSTVVFAAAAPTAAYVGRLAFTPLLEVDGSSPSLLAAGGTMAVGLAGMTAMPPLLDVHAQRSRRRLVEQGLSPRRLGHPVLAGLLGLGATVLMWGPVLEGGEDLAPVQAAAAWGVYGVAVGLPVAQLAENRRARRRAGWLP